MAEKKTYKVFSLNPLYQFGGDNWNIMFKEILRNEQACNLPQKVLNSTKFIARQSIVLHRGLTLNHVFSLGEKSMNLNERLL